METVTGGWCAPPSVLYDLDDIDRSVSLDMFPIVKVARGPINYSRPIDYNMERKMNRNERFLTMALGVALTSKCRFKHGAVVVKHGRVRGVSPNIQKNDPRNVEHKYCSLHAEIAAMKKAGWPEKATLYVARVNGQGESRLSKPCANCQTVLDKFRTKVMWTE